MLNNSEQRRQTVGLQDSGTREKHLMELLQLWQWMLEVAQAAPAWKKDIRVDQLKQNLPVAIDELKNTMVHMPGYDEEFYKFQIDTGLTPKRKAA